MSQVPCKHCADRVLGCHAVCKDYCDWSSKHKHDLAMERQTRPPVIKQSDFTSTSPKPGIHRKTRRI